MRAFCWIQQTAEALAPGSLQSGGSRTLFFPSPKQQMSCRPSCPQPASPRCIPHSQGEGSRASTKHPHSWDLCQGPPGTEGHCRLESPSIPQPTVTQGSCWLEDSLQRGKSFAPLPFWCCPAAQWGYGHSLHSLCIKLSGWEPKGPNQLVPVPPACLAWGSASTGRSLAEAALSCLLQQPPTCSRLQSRAPVFPQPQEGSLLQAEQAAGLTSHREGTSRVLGQDRDFARGTEGNLQARGQPKSALALCKPPQHA